MTPALRGPELDAAAAWAADHFGAEDADVSEVFATFGVDGLDAGYVAIRIAGGSPLSTVAHAQAAALVLQGLQWGLALRVASPGHLA